MAFTHFTLFHFISIHFTSFHHLRKGDFWTYDQQLDGLLVCDRRWEDLCQLDVGSWFPGFLEKEGLRMLEGKTKDDYNGLCIPTLKEVSTWCIENDIDVILEVKGEKGHEFYTGISHHITSHHFTSHHITSHHITSHRITPQYKITW